MVGMTAQTSPANSLRFPNVSEAPSLLTPKQFFYQQILFPVMKHSDYSKLRIGIMRCADWQNTNVQYF